MSAEVLREAAALMRERAERATTHTPWQLLGPDDDRAEPWTVASTHPVGDRTYVCQDARHAGEHIASWHPAVALAVADWLDETARRHDEILDNFVEGSRVGAVSAAENVTAYTQAVSVARTYLGKEQP